MIIIIRTTPQNEYHIIEHQDIVDLQLDVNYGKPGDRKPFGYSCLRTSETFGDTENIFIQNLNNRTNKNKY